MAQCLSNESAGEETAPQHMRLAPDNILGMNMKNQNLKTIRLQADENEASFLLQAAIFVKTRSTKSLAPRYTHRCIFENIEARPSQIKVLKLKQTYRSVQRAPSLKCEGLVCALEHFLRYF
jgi:hypothetical protein